MKEKESQIKAMKNRKKIIKRIRVTHPVFNFSFFCLLLSPKLSKKLQKLLPNLS
jgi:hypothetical protein